VIGVLALSACSTTEAHPIHASPTQTAATTPTTSPPVVTETFTRLPCKAATIVGQEGCAEEAVLRADAAINREVAALWWQQAGTSEARSRLSAAQQAWLAYRSATCASEADAFAGGSEAALETAQCLARLTQERAKELATQRALIP
jgi:uncharacterized protein YecT (DUF1311 family)